MMVGRDETKGVLDRIWNFLGRRAEEVLGAEDGARAGLPRAASNAEGGLPLFESADHPLADGLAPEWATGWGEDRYGLWVDFTLGAVCQRMRWIGTGQFPMGSPEGEPGRRRDGERNEGPQHEVRLSAGFWLFDTPVTQALWVAVMRENPSRFKAPKHPVEQVRCDDIEGFLQRINGLVSGLGLVLPTEAQWEYACRSGTATPNYVGDEKHLADIAWFNKNSGGQTQAVAAKRCNSLGLYDMLGNVWEWCSDGLRTYEAKAVTDPVGPSDGSRVLRGGSWGIGARNLRAASRNASAPGNCDDDIGFRCARVQP